MKRMMRWTGRTAGRAAIGALVCVLALVGFQPHATGAPRTRGVVERFAVDPLSGRGVLPFFGEGATDERFEFVRAARPHFPGDPGGTLRVLYDSDRPGARISTPLGSVLSLDESFSFGAILTIRSQGFFADPQGFAQISFGLWNSATTGMDRAVFPADSYDLIGFDYFPNITGFGGPFLSPNVFGGAVSTNAFDNFLFTSTQVPLPFEVPLLCRVTYDGTSRRLTLTVSRHRSGVAFEPVPGADLSLDLTRLSPGSLVDVVGIAAYFDGTGSLRAQVDYDLLFFGEVPPPFGTPGGRRSGRRMAPVLGR